MGKETKRNANREKEQSPISLSRNGNQKSTITSAKTSSSGTEDMFAEFEEELKIGGVATKAEEEPEVGIVK